jgi:Zn-dependent protease
MHSSLAATLDVVSSLSPNYVAVGTPGFCAGCGRPLKAGALGCESCGQLVYLDQLKTLAQRAASRYSAGDLEGAHAAWSEALGLLPAESPQHESVVRTIRQLESELGTRRGLVAQSPQVSGAPPSGQASSWGKRLGPIGAGGALLLKYKWLAFLLTKGKFVLFGLTKLKTLLSLLAFLGIYWALFGWWFAVGFVGSIFLHEMGHYVMVRRYGFAAEGPVFLPGFGAYVRWRGANVDPAVRARISLAGPFFGLLAALASLLIYFATGAGVWLAVAHVGAWINLLNLIPVFIFDGQSAMTPLSRQERMAVLVVAVAMLVITGEFVSLFIALGTAFRLYKRDFPQQPNQQTAYYFIGLMVLLGFLSWFSAYSAEAMRAAHNAF